MSKKVVKTSKTTKPNNKTKSKKVEEENKDLLENDYDDVTTSESDSSIEMKKAMKPKKQLSEKQLEALARAREKALEKVKQKNKTNEMKELEIKKKELMKKKDEKEKRKKERELKKIENEVNQESSEEEEIIKPKPKTKKKKIIIENDSDSEDEIIIKKKSNKPKQHYPTHQQPITRQIHYF